MADIEKTRDVSSKDPEKVGEVAPTNSRREGEIGEVKDVAVKHIHTNDGDEALKAFAGLSEAAIVMTPEMEKKLLRKIDWNLMPVCANDALL